MIDIVSDSLNEIHKKVFTHFAKDYQFESAPRGLKIREELVTRIELTNPRNRLIQSAARNPNYGFAVGELCWYIRGDIDLETMLYYNKRMSLFSDDGKTINSAYGARIFNEGALIDVQPSQFYLCVEELIRDNDSRRAVMHINQPRDLRKAVQFGSKDVPCTMSLQLFIRNKKLYMHTLMRSNDIVWGMPYDIFSFTSLQEIFFIILKQNGVDIEDIGSYYHTAGSLHIYSDHFEMAEKVSNEEMVNVSPMEPYDIDDISEIVQSIEPDLRNKLDINCDKITNTSSKWMIDQLISHRNKRTNEAK